MIKPYAKQHALVLWGGGNPGQRPRTKLAAIERHSANAFRTQVTFLLGDSWAKSSRWVPDTDLVKIWNGFPSPAEVREAKLAMPVED